VLQALEAGGLRVASVACTWLATRAFGAYQRAI
jgi:hypothetical protein